MRDHELQLVEVFFGSDVGDRAALAAAAAARRLLVDLTRLELLVHLLDVRLLVPLRQRALLVAPTNCNLQIQKVKGNGTR